MEEKKQVSMVDFDELCSLFERDPEEFERNRKRLIEEEISRRPPEFRERLRKFQWVLDMKRRKCKNPLEACFMFHEMMIENVYGENGLLRNMERLLDAAKGIETVHEPVGTRHDTRVLEFSVSGATRRMKCG
jgi:hypothetical protein